MNLRLAAAGMEAATGPTFFRGTFTLRGVGDTWLDLRGWGKGVVGVNGPPPSAGSGASGSSAPCTCRGHG